MRQLKEPSGGSSNRNEYRSIQHSLFHIQISALLWTSCLFGKKCATAKERLTIPEARLQFPGWSMVG